MPLIFTQPGQVDLNHQPLKTNPILGVTHSSNRRPPLAWLNSSTIMTITTHSLSWWRGLIIILSLLLLHRSLLSTPPLAGRKTNSALRPINPIMLSSASATSLYNLHHQPHAVARLLPHGDSRHRRLTRMQERFRPWWL